MESWGAALNSQDFTFFENDWYGTVATASRRLLWRLCGLSERDSRILANFLTEA